MSRVLGVDPGDVRVGLAVSDPDRRVATPAGTVPGGDGAPARIATAAKQRDCDTVVVGLPRALSGRETDSTRMARRLAEELAVLGLEVELWDERLSSAEAERLLIAAGRRREKRRVERDRIAATIVLQGWLDAQSGVGGPSPRPPPEDQDRRPR